MVFGQESNVPYRLLTYTYDYEIRGDFLLASMPKAAKQSGFRPLKKSVDK